MTRWLLPAAVAFAWGVRCAIRGPWPAAILYFVLAAGFVALSRLVADRRQS